jgi:hypothetical protein
MHCAINHIPYLCSESEEHWKYGDYCNDKNRQSKSHNPYIRLSGPPILSD